jgi:monoterpene epsilon-lactone hydrolase
MNNLLMLAAATMIASIGCRSAVSYDEKQTATMSPEAVAKLKGLDVLRVPIVTPSDEQIRKARRRFAETDRVELEEMKARFHPTIEHTTIRGVRVVTIAPKDVAAANKDKIILYIHGGGYVMGSATDRTGMLMTSEMGLKTYSIDYQLAPETKFPVALDECLTVYKELIHRFGAANIVGVSTSSGSGHMLGMLLKAENEKLPMIKAIALFSPLVDLTDHGDSISVNDGRDFLAYENQMDKFFIAPFVGKNANLEDPLVSPVYGSYRSTFPATVIVTGTRDVVLSGSTRMIWKLRRASVPTELIVGEGMWHAYVNFPDVPEAREARKASQEFLFAQLRSARASAVEAAHPSDAANISAR